MSGETGRSSWIRTNDLLLPKQALYQAELYSDGAGPIPAFKLWRNAGKARHNGVAPGPKTGRNPLQNRARRASCVNNANCVIVRSLCWGVAKW